MNVTQLAKELLEHKAKRSKLEAEVDEIKSIEGKLTYNILQLMDASSMDAFRVEGHTFTATPDYPVHIEDKDALFGWMKERGILEELVSFRTDQAASLYKRELDDCINRQGKDAALSFIIPGLKPGVEYKKLSIRKAK